MKNLTDNVEAVDLTNEYFCNKNRLEELEVRNKEILVELSRLSGGDPAKIGNHKLTMVHRKGSVSYAAVVKEHLPKLDLDAYRGNPSAYYQLK